MKVCNVEFKLFEEPVGICCSGGADSSLILYMLMLNHTKKIHIFTIASNFKKRKTVRISSNVIDKCIDLTGNNNIEHHISFVEKQNINNLFIKPKEYLNRDIIKYVYTGITANPPEKVLNSFKTQMDIKDRVDRDSSLKEVMINNFYMPFRNINKQKLAEIYNHYNLIDRLFPVTRSCEWTNDYNSIDPGYGHCGKCWWCEERKWGFQHYV